MESLDDLPELLSNFPQHLHARCVVFVVYAFGVGLAGGPSSRALSPGCSCALSPGSSAGDAAFAA